MNKDRRNQLKIRWQKARIAYPVLEVLRTRLLAVGGVELVISPREDQWAVQAEESRMLLQHGQCADGSSAILLPGEPRGCHAKTVDLLCKGEIASFVSGWALPDDGGWLEHSWGLSADAKIVETTVVQSVYFGRVWRRDRVAAEFRLHLEPCHKKRRTPGHKAVQLKFDFEVDGRDDIDGE
jgi:hypothetical protein